MIWRTGALKKPAAHYILLLFLFHFPKLLLSWILKQQQYNEKPLRWQKEIKFVKKNRERATRLFSQTALKALYRLYSPYTYFVVCSLLSDKSEMARQPVIAATMWRLPRAAMKYWPIPKSGSFKSRYRVLCVLEINSLLLNWFSSPGSVTSSEQREGDCLWQVLKNGTAISLVRPKWGDRVLVIKLPKFLSGEYRKKFSKHSNQPNNTSKLIEVQECNLNERICVSSVQLSGANLKSNSKNTGKKML